MSVQVRPAIRIEGLKSTVRQLKKLDVELVGEVKALNRAAAMTVARDAVGRAPVLSGRLASSIRLGATSAGGTVIAGGSALPYAPPIHWGWPEHNITPQPFLYEALDARRDEVLIAYETGLDALISRTRQGPD